MKNFIPTSDFIKDLFCILKINLYICKQFLVFIDKFVI